MRSSCSFPVLSVPENVALDFRSEAQFHVTRAALHTRVTARVLCPSFPVRGGSYVEFSGKASYSGSMIFFSESAELMVMSALESSENRKYGINCPRVGELKH